MSTVMYLMAPDSGKKLYNGYYTSNPKAPQAFNRKRFFVCNAVDSVRTKQFSILDLGLSFYTAALRNWAKHRNVV